ncbi:MAG: alpha-ketoacid dehydrogenase subunit beta [Candidatus Omnitrophota bacterium]
MPWSKISIEKNESGFDHSSDGTGRKISYIEAVREAFYQALDRDKRVFIMGQGVDDQTAMFGATLGLQRKYGPERVFDVPLSENALTGVAIGAALTGMRPVYMHNRPDFLLVAMDQIVNHASKWSYMFGGNGNVPMVIWAPVGRGWGTAAQHSQALQGLFMHVPGLKLAAPSTPYDAKGLIISAIADNNPVLIIEYRWQFKHTGYVPEEVYSIPFGRGVVRKTGKDVTIVGVSYMVIEALRAAEELRKEGIDAEVIDPRTLKPLDEEIILESIDKTGRLVVADTGWKTGGVSAEIAAIAVEKAFKSLKKPVKRVCCPDIPTPASYTLEAKFYPGAADIIESVKEIL